MAMNNLVSDRDPYYSQVVLHRDSLIDTALAN